MHADTPPEPSTAPPPPPPPRRRLTRRRHDRVLAGVAGGLGDYFSIDPVVFRIGFVAVSLLGGSGLLLYLIAWLVIPEEGARRSVGEATLRRKPSNSTIGVILLVVAAFVILDDVLSWGRPGVVVPLLLLLAGAALLLNPRNGGNGDGEDGHDREPEVADHHAADHHAADHHAADRPTATDEAAAPPRPSLRPTVGPPSRPRRPRPRLTRATLSLLLVAGGVAGLLDASDVLEVSVEVFLAFALVVTGVGLLVATWWSRAPGLIAIGVVLTLALGVTTAVEFPIEGGVGERTYRPVTVTELRSEYVLFAGDMIVDLSELDLGGGDHTVEIRQTFGELTVWTPRQARTVVDAQVVAGEVNLFGRHDNGLRVDQRATTGDPAGPTLRLDIEMGAGEVKVDSRTRPPTEGS